MPIGRTITASQAEPGKKYLTPHGHIVRACGRKPNGWLRVYVVGERKGLDLWPDHRLTEFPPYH